MTTADRTPILLVLLDDLVRARVDALAYNETNADLLHLSDGLALAVDHGAVAALWPPTRDDKSDADLALDVMLDDVTFELSLADHAAHLPAVVAMARRLADVAASLLVRGDTHQHEAAALWDAASRLLGLDTDSDDGAIAANLDRACEAAGIHVVADNVVLSSKLAAWAEQRSDRDGYHDEAMRLRGALEESRKDAASLREQVAELTRQRDESRRERDQAQAHVRQAIFGIKVPTAKSTAAADDSLRSIAIKAGAVECCVFYDTDRVTVAVTLHLGARLNDVSSAVWDAVMLDDPRTYVVRTSDRERRTMEETPEARRRRRGAGPTN